MSALPLPALAALSGLLDVLLGDAQPVQAPVRRLRVWLVPAVALLLAAAVASVGNREAFLLINRLTATGPDALWASITCLGDTHVALAVLLPLVVGRAHSCKAALVAVLLASVASSSLKYAVDALRPFAVLGAEQFHLIGPGLSSRSFPSGHALTAFTVAALAVGWSTHRHRLALALALASLIALSRVAVGAHWPLDALAGASLGWLCGLCGLRWFRAEGAHWRLALQVVVPGFMAGSTLWLLVGFDSGYPQARWLEQLIAATSLTLALALGWRQWKRGSAVV